MRTCRHVAIADGLRAFFGRYCGWRLGLWRAHFAPSWLLSSPALRRSRAGAEAATCQLRQALSSSGLLWRSGANIPEDVENLRLLVVISWRPAGFLSKACRYIGKLLLCLFSVVFPSTIEKLLFRVGSLLPTVELCLGPFWMRWLYGCLPCFVSWYFLAPISNINVLIIGKRRETIDTHNMWFYLLYLWNL